MTAVEFLITELTKLNFDNINNESIILNIKPIYDAAKEMEKEQKIELLKSLVYSVCIGDDVEDVEEWLKKHELTKSKQNGNKSKLGA